MPRPDAALPNWRTNHCRELLVWIRHGHASMRANIWADCNEATHVSLTSSIQILAYSESKNPSGTLTFIRMGTIVAFFVIILFFIHRCFCRRHDSVQPGCLGVVCCHSRSYEYYAESVYPGRENDFMATKCSSFRAYKLGRCSTEKLPMGIATPTHGRGTYYLETRPIPPFGKNRLTAKAWPFRRRDEQRCKHSMNA